jgi:hypothetical protein
LQSLWLSMRRRSQLLLRSPMMTGRTAGIVCSGACACWWLSVVWPEWFTDVNGDWYRRCDEEGSDLCVVNLPVCYCGCRFSGCSGLIYYQQHCLGCGKKASCIRVTRSTATCKDCALCQEPADERRMLKRFLQAGMFGSLLFVVVFCLLDPG